MLLQPEDLSSCRARWGSPAGGAQRSPQVPILPLSCISPQAQAFSSFRHALASLPSQLHPDRPLPSQIWPLSSPQSPPSTLIPVWPCSPLCKRLKFPPCTMLQDGGSIFAFFFFYSFAPAGIPPRCLERWGPSSHLGAAQDPGARRCWKCWLSATRWWFL